MIDPAATPSREEKADAFEWLRQQSLTDSADAHHAAVMMYEIARLNAVTADRETIRDEPTQSDGAIEKTNEPEHT